MAIEIEQAKSWLAQRWPGIAVWWGRATMEWWALDRGGLVEAPTPEKLDAVLTERMGAWA